MLYYNVRSEKCVDILSQGITRTPLDKLGIMDAAFGLIPALAAILKHNDQETIRSFDISEFVTRMRQFMILEECFCSLNHDKLDQELANVTKADFLIFDNRVENNKLPGNFLEKIFSPLIKNNKYLFSYNYKAVGHYLIKKNPLFVTEHPYIVKDIGDIFYLQNKIKTGTLRWENSPIVNPDSFINRVELTCELFDELKKQNIVQFASSKLSNPELAKFYDELLTLPLIGTLREFPNQTVLYVMIYYQTHGEVELEKVNIQLDHLFPKIIQHHPKIRKIVSQCATFCKPSGGHDCYITKLLARPYDSTSICAVFFMTFLKDIKKSKQEKLPLKQLAEYVRTTLRWEVYMKHLSYKKLPMSSEDI